MDMSMPALARGGFKQTTNSTNPNGNNALFFDMSEPPNSVMLKPAQCRKVAS